MNASGLFEYSQSLLDALGYRDLYTKIHSDRVCGISLELGAKLQLTEAERIALPLSASLHDVGKLAIPDRILHNPNTLRGADWERMKLHAVIGGNIINAAQIPGSHLISLAVRYHHESFDGTGYPEGLDGDHIPLLSRLLNITDSYDAMTSKRAYRQALPHGWIMKEMRTLSGIKYDPEIFEIFVEVIENSTYKGP